MTAKGKINKGKEQEKYTILTMDPENESVSLTLTSVLQFPYSVVHSKYVKSYPKCDMFLNSQIMPCIMIKYHTKKINK